MSAQLMGDLIEWRRTPFGAELSDKEFIVLLTIADRVLNESTRRMFRKKGDDCDLHERIRQVVGVNEENFRKLLQRLAARGLDVRVPFRKDKHGNPVFAARGHAMDFRLPEMPTMLNLPDVAEECG